MNAGRARPKTNDGESILGMMPRILKGYVTYRDTLSDWG